MHQYKVTSIVDIELGTELENYFGMDWTKGLGQEDLKGGHTNNLIWSWTKFKILAAYKTKFKNNK